MGVLRSAFKMASTANNFILMDKIKGCVWEKAEPKVADFIRGIDFSTVISGNAYVKEYDTAYTDEQKKDFEEKGRNVVEMLERVSKYDTGERTIESAMADMFSDIATAYKDDPGKVACWIDTNTENGETICDIATRFNEKMRELESYDGEVTAESIEEFIQNDEELKRLYEDIKELPKTRLERPRRSESDGAEDEKRLAKNEEFSKSFDDSLYNTFRDVPVIGGFVERYKEKKDAEAESQQNEGQSDEQSNRDIDKLKEAGLYMSEDGDSPLGNDLQSDGYNA